MRAVLAILLLVFAVAPVPARAESSPLAMHLEPVRRVAEWTEGLMAAQAPAESALQSMRQVIALLQAEMTPQQRGALLIQVGPQLVEALAQVRRAQAAVAAYPALASGDQGMDALAFAAYGALQVGLANLETALSGFHQMHLAAARGDAAGVRQAASSFLVFPPAMLRSMAASFRMLALQVQDDEATRHYHLARASFYEASAMAIDVSAPLDRVSIIAKLDETGSAITRGRAALEQDRVLADAPGLTSRQRTLVSEIMDVQARGYLVTEQAATALREGVASLPGNASPPEQIAAIRHSGVIERENQALLARMSELAAQLLQ